MRLKTNHALIRGQIGKQRKKRTKGTLLLFFRTVQSPLFFRPKIHS